MAQKQYATGDCSMVAGRLEEMAPQSSVSFRRSFRNCRLPSGRVFLLRPSARSRLRR